MKRLLALLGAWPLVWTEDHDGSIRLRAAFRFDWRDESQWRCSSIVPFDRAVILREDGGTDGKSYVGRWCEWKHNLRHVTFPKQVNP